MTICVNTIGGHDSNAFIGQILLMILLFDVIRNKLDKNQNFLYLYQCYQDLTGEPTELASQVSFGRLPFRTSLPIWTWTIMF